MGYKRYCFKGSQILMIVKLSGVICFKYAYA